MRAHRDGNSCPLVRLLVIPPETTVLHGRPAVVEGGTRPVPVPRGPQSRTSRLIVFDSFEGIPDTVAPPREHLGGPVRFFEGDYWWSPRGSHSTVRRYGPFGVQFGRIFLMTTLPPFCQPVIASYLERWTWWASSNAHLPNSLASSLVPGVISVFARMALTFV